MRRFLPIIAVLLAIAPALRADTLILKDGTRIEGDVKRIDGSYVVTGADGKTTKLDASKVESIRLGKTDGPKDRNAASADRLASLRRSADSLSDPAQAIERYRQFIESNPDTPAAADAAKDLSIWQDRLDRKLVRLSGKWITPEDRATLIEQSAGAVTQARDLLRANRLHDAEPILAQAVELDPKNAAAWYLTGVMLYRQDKIPQARKAFESANAAFPQDAATLNNLGVILWRQNQHQGALALFDQAMLALPANKEILNNVAEALSARKEDPKRNAVYAKVLRRFTGQDTQLQAVMAQYGWYRWGATWVDQVMMDRLKEAEKQVREKMDQMQRDFDAAQTKIGENERRIASNITYMQDMESSSIGYDSNGRMFRAQLPAAYFNYKAENERLMEENQQLKSSMAQMRENARRVEQQLPQPKFTGVLRLIDVEGMPRSSTFPATVPSTAPAEQH